MTRHVISFLVLFTLFFTKGLSQVYPVSTITTATPPYPVSLDGFVSESANKINLQIHVNDITLVNYPVKLRLVLSNNNVRISTSPVYLSQPIYINGGDVIVLNAFDLSDLFKVENLDFSGYSKNQYISTGQLPDGIYQMSFEVVDYNRNFTISSSIPSFVYIYVNEPPILNLPLNKTQLDFNDQQNIMFNWTFRHSPFSRPGLVPEYTFELWEVYPDNLNPYFVAQSTKPVYSEILNGTSINYNVMHPLFIPGRKYAWRIRVSDPEGITRFKSDGYSDLYWFKYGVNCTPPELEVEKTGAEHITVAWQTEQAQNNFTVRYRPSNKDEWYSSGSEFMSHKIENLKSNTEYIIEVEGMCGSQESGYSDAITVRTDRSMDYQCGANAVIPEIENHEPLPSLRKGDYIKAGDFEVEIWSAEGSNGTFNGKGFVLVPLFNFLKLEADLINVSINTDYQLTGGKIKTVYNLSNSLTVNLGDVFGDDDNDDEGIPEENDFAEIAEIKIQADNEIASVYVSGNNVTVTTSSGEVITNTVNSNQIVAVTAPSGEQYVVDGSSNTVYTQASNKGSAPAANSNELSQAGASDIQYTVTFESSSEQMYGLDIPDDKSPPNNYNTKTLAGTEQYIPWKSIESGRFDKVIASIEGSPSDSVFFSRESTSMVMIAPTTDDSKKQLMITGDGHEDTDELYAYYTEKSGDSSQSVTTYYAGSLNLVSYEKQDISLCLVSVNGSVVPDAQYVQTELNKIYKQAVIGWNVTELSGGLTVELPRTNQKMLDNTDANDNMDYTDEMKLVKKAMKDHNLYDRQTVYLFFFDEAVDENIKGYMPLKGQFGFIFKFSQWPNEYLRTLAHEVAHGPFRLRHTFSDENPYKQNEGETSNLMDYAGPNATILHKYQWDLIHNPETILFAWLEDEEEGELKRLTAKLSCIYWNEKLLPASGTSYIIKDITSQIHLIAKKEKNDGSLENLKVDWEYNEEIYERIEEQIIEVNPETFGENNMLFLNVTDDAIFGEDVNLELYFEIFDFTIESVIIDYFSQILEAKKIHEELEKKIKELTENDELLKALYTGEDYEYINQGMSLLFERPEETGEDNFNSELEKLFYDLYFIDDEIENEDENKKEKAKEIIEMIDGTYEIINKDFYNEVKEVFVLDCEETEKDKIKSYYITKIESIIEDKIKNNSNDEE